MRSRGTYGGGCLALKLTVFSKELREIGRDKRVLYSALVGPILLVVVITRLMSFLEQSFTSPKAQKVHYLAPSYSSTALKAMQDGENLQLIPVQSSEQGRKLVEDGGATLFIEFPSNAPATNEPEIISAVFDSQESKSQIVLGMLQKAVGVKSAERLVELLQSASINPKLAVPIQVEPKPIERKKEGVGSFLAGFLPYLAVIWAFYGAFGNASDIVAGEKERNTLETLLISPISRTEIAIGKFLALMAVSLTSSLSSLITVYVMGFMAGGTAKVLFPSGVHLTLGTVGTVLAVIVPLSAMFSALLLGISAFSKNSRECQTYLSLASFVVIMPAIFSQFIGYTDFARAGWVNFVPVLNSASVLREALLGRYNVPGILTTAGVSFVLAAVCLVWAVRMFERERILVRI